MEGFSCFKFRGLIHGGAYLWNLEAYFLILMHCLGDVCRHGHFFHKTRVLNFLHRQTHFDVT